MSEYYRAIVPEGTHLAPSKGTDGTFRGAALDNETNILKRQAEFAPIELGSVNEAPSRPYQADVAIAIFRFLAENPELVLMVITGARKMGYWIKEKIEQLHQQAKLKSSQQNAEISAAPVLKSVTLASGEAQMRLNNIVVLARWLADELNKYAVACYREGVVVQDNVLEWLLAVEKLAAQETIDDVSKISERDLIRIEETLTEATTTLESTAHQYVSL